MSKYLNIRVDDELFESVTQTAQEDDRRQVDQTRALIRMGLQFRDEVKRKESDITGGKTQINPEALRR